MSSGTMASITPEIPPRVNIVRKPSAKSSGVSMCSTPRHSVASQEKILIPVGTAMIAVVIIIGMRIHDCMPDTNMWWAHTVTVSYTHLRAHETRHDLVCRLLLEKKKQLNKTKR